MAKKKLNKDELAAMRIQAMLQGVSFEELMQSAEESEDAPEGDIDIQIEDEEKPKGKKKTAAKKKSTSSADEPLTTQSFVPELDKYKHLKRDLKMKVIFAAHDIPYKEQLWGVPTRALEYKLEIVTNPKNAKDIAELFKSSKDEAADGTVRYFRLVNYQENVSHRIKEIAYVQAKIEGNKLHTQYYVKSQALKDSCGDPAIVKSDLKKLTKGLAE